MSGNDSARELLDRIADGAAVDWNQPTGIDAPLLEAAHTFERVRNAYRRIGTGDPHEPALFHWGPLIVLERTAAGATGEIYRAWDPGLSTMVALKLLRPEAAAAGLTNREFLREAKLLARIGQRNLLRGSRAECKQRERCRQSGEKSFRNSCHGHSSLNGVERTSIGRASPIPLAR